MLVLTLRAGESVMIGDDTEVTMLSSTGKQVRIGFDAPDNIVVNRRKIYDRIQEEKRIDNERSNENIPSNNLEETN